MPEPLDSLPNTARLWLVALDGKPEPDAVASALADVQAWLPTWASHGRPVQAEAAMLEGRVLAVGALISPEDLNAGVSGCGIDAMQHMVEEALAAHGLTQASALSVSFHDGSAWQTVPRPAFRRRLREGTASGDTPVLDLTLDTVGALRDRGLVHPAAETWMAQAFRIGAEAA